MYAYIISLATASLWRYVWPEFIGIAQLYQLMDNFYYKQYNLYINTMCLPCTKKNMRVWSFMQNRMTGYPIKFDQNQLQELKKKFKKISGNRQTIDKISFQENMGILGMSSAEGFSDRLFNSFDTDTDGKISYQDFIQYMEVLKSGSQKNKAKISYRLIDVKNKNSVDKNQFKQFLVDYFRSWTSITNSIITPEIKQRTDQYVQRLYNKVRVETGKNYIDFGYYAQKVFFDPQFIQSFEYITQGVANMFISNQKIGQDDVILYKVLKNIRQINNALTNQPDRQSNSNSDNTSFNQRYSGPGASILNKSQRVKISVMKQQIPDPLVGNNPSFSNNYQQRNKVFTKLDIPSPANNMSNSNIKSGHNTSLINTQYNNHNNINNLNNINNTAGSKSNKNTTQTTMANNTLNNFSQINSNLNSHEYNTTNFNLPDNGYQCKNCFKLQILEKKLQFFASKIKKIVEETQRVFERLDQKLYDKLSNKKNQTVGNIHVQTHPQHRPVQGNMIFFGDDNWNQVLNMMIGIQMAVRSVKGFQQMIYEEPKDFDLKYYFELVPRRFGDQNYLSRICSFTDYAPNTFNHIRKIFNIDNQQYINSIGPNKLMTSLMMGQVSSLTGLTSQGKSGSFFYYTADGKYMLKTIQYRQYKHLRKILEQYYKYIKNNPNTLITKFFGLHKLLEKDAEGSVIGKSYFVIMANVFNTKQKIIERYDIKGSSYGRQTRSTHPNATKKDNDFKKNRRPLEIDPKYRAELMRIIKKDAQFFQSHQIIDYSLLIGVIKKNPVNSQSGQRPRLSPQKLKSRQSLQYQMNELRQSHLYQNLGRNQEYIFGIIDILTQYSTRKAMEYYFKSLLYGNGVSAIPPGQYSTRFVHFIDETIFQKVDPSSPPKKQIAQAESIYRNPSTQNKEVYQLMTKNNLQRQQQREERKNRLMVESKQSFVSSYNLNRDSHN